MKYALIFSILLNLLLIGFLAYEYNHEPGLKPLPDKKPDFNKVEGELREALSKPENAELFELMKFNHDDWICRASILEKYEKPSSEHWSRLQDIVNRVSISCAIPGRQSGWVADPEDPSRFIGTYIEFGYSNDLGYDRKNTLCY